MSWRCTEGPTGLYPGDDGYEEGLISYSIRSFEQDSKESSIYWFIKLTLKNSNIPWINIKDVLYKDVVEYLKNKHGYQLVNIYPNSKMTKSDSRFCVYTCDEDRYITEMTNIKKNIPTVFIIDKTTRYGCDSMKTSDVPDFLNRIISDSKHPVVFSRTSPDHHNVENTKIFTVDYFNSSVED